MPSSRSVFPVLLTAILLLLISTVEARCHNLSSTAFTHCPNHSNEAHRMVKATATAPYAMKAIATGSAKQQKKVQQEAAIEAQEKSPTDTSADKTPWFYGTGANQTLPSPSPDTTLMTVALGSGTQNYTCPSPSLPSATPTLIGATASLYHLSTPNTSPLSSISLTNTPAIGKHYFSAAGTPSFQFFDSKTLGLLQAAKKMQIPAPGGAGAGVPWLQLVSTGTGNGGLREVYRVKTEGGSPPAGVCEGKALGTAFEVPYRAQYWFYGTGS